MARDRKTTGSFQPGSQKSPARSAAPPSSGRLPGRQEESSSKLVQQHRQRGDEQKRLDPLLAVVAQTATGAQFEPTRGGVPELALPTSRGMVRLRLDLSPADGDQLLACYQRVQSEIDGRVGAAADSSQYLSSAERGSLRQGGFLLGEARAASPNFAYEEMIRLSVSTAEAAAHLNLTEARIRQRIQNHGLLAIKHGRGWRLPAFQFTEEGLVPALEVVLVSMPRDLATASAIRFFETPQPELTRHGRNLTPRDWLRETGDACPVIALARDL